MATTSRHLFPLFPACPGSRQNVTLLRLFSRVVILRQSQTVTYIHYNSVYSKKADKKEINTTRTVMTGLISLHKILLFGMKFRHRKS